MDLSRRNAIGLAGGALGALSLTLPEAGARARQPSPGGKWWIDDPVRMALVLYDELRPPLDTDAFVAWLVDLGANAVVLPVGGVAAYYPTTVPFHARAPGLPERRDLVDEIVAKAHARGIRVVGRFEWTLNQSAGIEAAHPDWLQRTAQGSSPSWQGMHLMCMNGGYVREHSRRILDEALSRFALDGIFFNWLAQRMSNGPCHCAACRTRFRDACGREIPEKPDEEYLRFMATCVDEVAAGLTTFLRGKRTDAGFNLMFGPDADSISTETHGAPIASSHGYWIYQASEAVNRLRTAHPQKMVFNSDAAFIDGYWRYAHRASAEGEMRAYQNMAHGAGPYLFVNGSIAQFDTAGLRGAAPAFRFHRAHEELYLRQENAARILLLEEPGAGVLRRYGDAKGPDAGNGGFGYRESDGAGTPGDGSPTALRGLFRLLSERHLPFALSSDTGWIDDDPGRYDLVISYSGAPAALDRYLRGGGRVLVTGATAPALDIPRVIRRWPRKETLSSYWHVRDRRLLPSLDHTQLIFNYSDILELATDGAVPLAYVPKTPTQPMERVGAGMADSAMTGLHIADYGKGRLAFIPWDVADLYYRFGNAHHADLVSDVIDHLLPAGRQITTNAHPSVEITLQHQRESGRALIHCVNLSGCAAVSHHAPLPMERISFEVAGRYRHARAVALDRDLPVQWDGRCTRFVLPRLQAYDVIVLTPF